MWWRSTSHYMNLTKARWVRNCLKGDGKMLTQAEELLIDYLLLSKATQGTGVMISIMLKEHHQQLKMCRYLSDNPEATEEEIVAMAEKIAGEK